MSRESSFSSVQFCLQNRNIPLIPLICTPCLLLNRCLFRVHLFLRMTSPPLLDEGFVSLPWRCVHIISTTLPAPSSLEQLFNSLIAAFLSVSHNLNILLVPDSPTASARSRLPSLPPSMHLSFLLLLCLVHFNLMWNCCVSAYSKKKKKKHSFVLHPFFFILAFFSGLCASSVAFIFIVLLPY